MIIAITYTSKITTTTTTIFLIAIRNNKLLADKD